MITCEYKKNNKCNKCIVFYPQVFECLTKKILLPLTDIAMVLKNIINNHDVSNASKIRINFLIEEMLSFLHLLHKESLEIKYHELQQEDIENITNVNKRNEPRINISDIEYQIYAIYKKTKYDILNISLNGCYIEYLYFKPNDREKITLSIEINKIIVHEIDIIVESKYLDENGTGCAIVFFENVNDEIFFLDFLYNLYKKIR